MSILEFWVAHPWHSWGAMLLAAATAVGVARRLGRSR